MEYNPRRSFKRHSKICPHTQTGFPRFSFGLNVFYYLTDYGLPPNFPRLSAAIRNEFGS